MTPGVTFGKVTESIALAAEFLPKMTRAHVCSTFGTNREGDAPQVRSDPRQNPGCWFPPIKDARNLAGGWRAELGV
jgi:hypothetical protein